MKNPRNYGTNWLIYLESEEDEEVGEVEGEHLGGGRGPAHNLYIMYKLDL